MFKCCRCYPEVVLANKAPALREVLLDLRIPSGDFRSVGLASFASSCSGTRTRSPTTSHSSMVVPITVLPEACYLIKKYLGGRVEVEFARSVQRGEVRVEFLRKEDLVRAVEVMDTYCEMGLGFVDASIVAVAERLGIRELLTTDRRHFSVVRPRHCPRFDLKP